MTSTYPMYTSNATPTIRSAQAQQRINDFASKIFTPYELQKLRTYIPGIKFAVEEAGLYKQNIVEKSDLLKKLQEFVASVYIYDILGSLMRDINERVRRATDSALLEVDRAEMAKLVNALRGFVATEQDPISKKSEVLAAAIEEYKKRKAEFVAQATKVSKAVAGAGGVASKIDAADAEAQFDASEGPEPTAADIDTGKHSGSRARDANEKVYMYRIPPSTMALIKGLEDLGTLKTGGALTKYKIANNGLGSKDVEISAFSLRPENLPVYNLLLGGHASDDSVPAKLLQQLSSPNIDASRLAIKHRERLRALDVDDPPPVNADVLDSLQSKNRYVFNEPAKLKLLSVDGAVPATFGKTTYDDPLRLGGNPRSSFRNAIFQFVKRDVIAFNRLRTSILNNIDQWWTNNGALNLIDGSGDATSFYNRLSDADYRLSGIPQPSCPSGSAQVYYDRDPSGLVLDPGTMKMVRDPIRARVVDPYIRAADGTWVENPEARVGPFCQKRKNIKDVMSGANEYLPTGPLPTFDHPGYASHHRRRRPAASSATRSAKPATRHSRPSAKRARPLAGAALAAHLKKRRASVSGSASASASARPRRRSRPASAPASASRSAKRTARRPAAKRTRRAPSRK